MAAHHPPAFRGRASERSALDRVVDDARRGESAVLVIRGEEGIGKTALLRYAARQAAGFRVAELAGVESEMELAFAGLHQLCAPLLDRLDAIPQPQGEALRVAFGLAAGAAPDHFLVALATLSLVSEVAEERPLLCLVDDAHWLDGASARALGFVARRLLAEPVALVFAVRHPSADHELVGLPELRVEGLGDDDARAVLASVIPGPLDEAVRDRIVLETRGNPLALLELPHGVSAAGLGGGFAVPGTQDIPGRIEEEYRDRIAVLPEPTRRLLLLAAAEPLGDATLLWRAAAILGIEPAAAEAAQHGALLEIGARVRFRHPLVRSAVYRSAPLGERRAAHEALAAATDGRTDPDRRSWHRAHAATAPDEQVAVELVESAAGAHRRGGIAAAAAFLERAAAFTPEPGERAARALSAARAKFAAGDVAGTESLLATAEAGPLPELARAEVERLHAQIAFDVRRGRDAPALLLHAAQRLEPIDRGRAHDAYLEALIAAIYADRLAAGVDAAAVARAARATTHGADPASARQLLLLGLIARFTDGYAAAAPPLTAALRAYRRDGPGLDWLGVACSLAAMELWDDEAWFELASAQVELARSTGTLVLLPYALDYLAGLHVQSGELARAAALAAEAESLQPGLRARTLPYIPLRLAAMRGEAAAATSLHRRVHEGARARGEGAAIGAADHALAVLHNALGQYQRALAAAQDAAASDAMATRSWALAELVEAASRCGREDLARAAADELAARADAAGTPWARGTAARARALVTEGAGSEQHFREAIDWLGRCRMAVHLARARLGYGEWLRRANRRLDAREELRVAFEMFTAMGAEAFAERARRELSATGERVRSRRDDTRDRLTPQEEQIARLARDGRTNPEIGAELYLSPRTVEWHLRKVFTKLDISSRKGLNEALASSERDAARA